jgi:hypothetical protein
MNCVEFLIATQLPSWFRYQLYEHIERRIVVRVKDLVADLQVSSACFVRAEWREDGKSRGKSCQPSGTSTVSSISNCAFHCASPGL